MGWLKAALFVVAGLVVVKTYDVASSVAKVGQEMTVTVTPEGAVVGLLSTTLRLKVVLSNPISRTIRVKFPNLQVSYQGIAIGRSDPQNQMINIIANGKTEFNMAVYVSSIGLLTSAVNIARQFILQLRNRAAVEVIVKVMTGADYGLGVYEITKDVKLTYMDPS